MRFVLVLILLALPMLAQVSAVKIYPVPTDWTTVKRPTLAATVTALKTERTAGECQECLHISEPGRYVDGKGVTWYVINHPRPGTVAVQDRAFLIEIARCPKFTDGEHDEKWLTEYFADQIKAGTVKQWREKAAVYDKEGKVISPAVPLIPADWRPVNESK